MKIKKWLGVAALATVAGLALAACGNSEKKADNATTVKIATVNRSGSEEKRWDKIQELVKKDGITLEFTEFTDYSQPNKATADGEVDLNAFQHYNFLNNWNKENGKHVLCACLYCPCRWQRLYDPSRKSSALWSHYHYRPCHGPLFLGD